MSIFPPGFVTPPQLLVGSLGSGTNVPASEIVETATFARERFDSARSSLGG